MRVATIAACLLLSAGAGLAADARGGAPPSAVEESSRGVERWLHNSRERTDAGRAAWEAEDAPAASTALDQALRLRPELPEARFNAGSGRLRAGAPGAVELLESAARDASPALAPRAWYNLGNAHLAGGDPRGAIAAYRESLLRDPGQTDAKHNLELALRRLEQQQKQEQERQQQQQKQQQEAGGKDDESQRQPTPPSSDDRDERQENSPQPSGERQPQFRDQPDMSREQAEALLAAVENLEREQRRKEAQRRAAARTQVEIDW